MQGIRGFLQTNAGKSIAIAAVMAAISLLFVVARRNFGPTEAAAFSQNRWFVCSETGKPFQLEVQSGMTFPVRSPHTGRNTGHLAELCYWTADGQIKQQPTPVLLNASVNQPGPTFCPDCGRLVVARNPPPTLGHPPPTRAQYESKKPGEE